MSNLKWLSKTPITLRGMSSALTISLASVFACIPHDANACSFAIQRSIKFAPHVSSMSNRDRVELAETLIRANDSVARTGLVVIYGITDERSKDGLATTKKRVKSVMAYLNALGVSESRMNVDYEIWRAPPETPESERFHVLVEFLPASSPCG